MGWAFYRIPRPVVTGVFWSGNTAAPWLLLAFLAGVSQNRRGLAPLAGALADVALVTGFYSQFLLLDIDQGRSPGATHTGSALTSGLSRWITFITPWLVVAVIAGGVFGAVGAWWRRSGSRLAVAAVSVPFVVEPALWTLVGAQVPPLMWAGELLVGVVIAALLLRPRPPTYTVAIP